MRAVLLRKGMSGGVRSIDRDNTPLVSPRSGSTGDFSRRYNFPDLGSTVGYSHAVYGQSGLEASLDPYLRGLGRHIPTWSVWWHHLLYGRPPPGLDIRLSVDMNLQQIADEMLGDRAVGSVILLNAGNGEILSLASHPTFDPNQLEDNWLRIWSTIPKTPLLNRAIQGQYQPGTALGSFLLAALTAEGGDI